MASVTVLIPVGPQPEYLDWLPEAVESVFQQTVPVDEILLIGDGSDLNLVLEDLPLARLLEFETNNQSKTYYSASKWGYEDERHLITYWQSPWNIGFSQAFNCGVGLADNDLIIYLAADDKLMSTAVEDCLKTWQENNEKDAWYSMTYQLQDGTLGDVPNNAAMITRPLWAWLRGFPPAAFAGPDAVLLSCLMVHASDRIIKVAQGKPNYWIRQHEHQETRRQFSFYAASGIMEVIRNKETERFVPNLLVELK